MTIFEPGARSNLALALALPDDRKEFFLTRLPGGTPLAAGQFRQTVTASKPKNTRSSINVKASLVPDLSGLLNAMAETLPPSGRGIMVMVHVRDWSIAGETDDVLVDATFSRFRHGARDISTGVGLRFQTLSLKDPAVKQTIVGSRKLAFEAAQFPCTTYQTYAVTKQRVNVPLQDFPSFLPGRDGFASKTTHWKDS